MEKREGELIDAKKREIYKKLYKYRSLETVYDNRGNIVYDGVERCVDIMENNRLYFPTREKLNDPYEGMAVPIHLCVCGEEVYEAMGLLHPIIEDEMNQYRVLSLSGDPVSMQMWAHYAANYNGVCFEFRGNGVLGQAAKVEYIENPFEMSSDLDEDEIEDIIRQNFYYKSINWQYEDEYRIIDKSDKEYVYFHENELAGIIIGKVAAKREDVKERIIEVAKKKNIPVYYTLFTPGEFKLSIVTVEEVMELGSEDLEDILYL